MKITNLEHVESVSTSNVLGSSGRPSSISYRLSYSNSYNLFSSHVYAKGNAATAGATADAIGHDTFSSTYTNSTAVQGWGSSSSSHSEAYVA